MATRFYLPSSGSAPSSPTVSTGWMYSASAFARYPTKFAKGDTAHAWAVGGWPGATDENGLLCTLQYVSPPLDVDQTISGTVSAALSCLENATLADAYLGYSVRVMQGDTSTERGVLKAPSFADTEMTTGGATRIVNAVAVTSVNALAGDRIVIELGSRFVSPVAGAYAGPRIGNPDVTDVPLTSGGADTDKTGWLELSTTITFNDGAPPLGQVTETDTAQVITLSENAIRDVAQASEADTAQAITTVLGALTIAVNQSNETDLARPIAALQGVTLTIGQVAESDLAQSIAVYSATTIAIGQVTELDVAQVILEAYSNQTLSVGQVTETDAAQVISSPTPINIALAQASEIDLSLAVTLYATRTIALGQASETDIARAITVVFGVTETWSINLEHPTTGLPLTGLGNSVVKFEAYQESTEDWFNPATGALQAAQPTPLALLEDISGNHNGRYAAATTIGAFNTWMVLHIYWDYDAGDGRGSIRRHAWSRVYYNAGVELLPGLSTAEHAALLAVELATDTLEASVAALPSAAQIATATLAAATATPIAANMKQANSVEIIGAGTSANKFRGVNA